MTPVVRVLLRYALPLAMIALLSVYLITRGDDRLQYELPTLPTISATAIDRVEVARGDARVALERTGDGWLIEGPGFPADPSAVRAMVQAAANLRLTDLIAGEPTYGRYGLDEREAFTVTFLEGSTTRRVLGVGKRAPTYSHTYVLIDDDPRVYQANGDLTRVFSTQVEVLRDRSILSFEPGDIASIVVTTAGGATEELRRGLPPTLDAAPTWSTADGGERDPEAVRGALDLLSRMRATRFTDALPETAPLVDLELQGAEATHRLTIYPKADNAHVATSSHVDGPFVLLPVLLADVFAAVGVESE